MSENALQHAVDDMELTLGDRLGFGVVALLIVFPLGLVVLAIQTVCRRVSRWYHG